MMTNLLFSQLTAIGKRFAMVLTMLLIVGIGQAWGEEVTFTANVDKGETSVTKDGITVSMSTMSRDDNYRTYANTDMNVSSETATITKIVITCTGSGTNNYGPGKFSGTGYTYSSSTGTWTGSSSSISLKASAQVRITEIVITYIQGGNTGDDNIDEPIECDEYTYELVTDVDELSVGDNIIIVAAATNRALSTNQKTNNRGEIEITKTNEGNTIRINSDVQVLTIENGIKSNTFAFRDTDGTNEGYLYAASSSDNYLKTKQTLDENGSWSVSIISTGVATIKAQGTNTRNWLRYNPGSSLFSCYASGMADVAIYKQCTTEPTYYLLRK